MEHEMPSLTIRPINTGFVTTMPKEYLYHHSVHSFRKNVPNHRIEMPVFTFLVEGGATPLLIDTGMADTERASTYHHPESRQPEGMAIHEQLAAIGYRPEDIGIVVLTHMHWDHVYNMEKFTKAKFFAHEREVAFALDPIPLYYKSYEHPALGIRRPFEGIEIARVRGETEIVPGVRVFESFGHSPGHMSVEVDTAEGQYLCVGDSVFVMANLDPVPEMHYDITPPGRFYNIVETWDSIMKQKARAKDRKFILCSHDAGLIDRVAKTPVLG
jgi:glyoxylase-like metal-dependent hydrolase (beta-lactamase superfamily II)